jgi:dolichol-phosphate mannosyltransferase
MALEQNLKEMERKREAYWLRYPATSDLKLRWRAFSVRHCFHVLPGETILEIGGGSGLWTQHLASVLRGENPITAAVFNTNLAESASRKQFPNTKIVDVKNLLVDLPEESFDYVVGTGILCHDEYPQNLELIRRVLKPGGEFLFFEANHWNPQVFAKDFIRPLGRWAGHASCQKGLRRYKLMHIASQHGFTHLDIIPYDLLHPRTPKFAIPLVRSLAFVLEHSPVIREMCGTLYIWGKKPGNSRLRRPRVSLAVHPKLFGSTSIVVPCHNEEMNVPKLVDDLVLRYGDYIHEIIIVNDNSTDRTAQVTEEVARREPRVRLINRQPPNGVGRALRDGYAAATGSYILTMDSDFVQILPELRDLFDAVAEGYDGAIGSRFSHESMLINYPFLKTVSNRGFHLLVNLLLPLRVRDLSNNLKLYRADIFKTIEIEQPHFAANAETGLKPMLAGYKIKEVPISWINRTTGMGQSSFRVVNVAPHYFSALVKIIWKSWRGRNDLAKRASENLANAPQAGGTSEVPSPFLDGPRK